jgi:small-conductance mechanosensitive channel
VQEHVGTCRVVVLSAAVVGVAAAALNFPETGLAASAAVLAVSIGFGAQSTLSNLVAGFVLALSHPIRRGDLVHVDDRDGVVDEIRAARSEAPA